MATHTFAQTRLGTICIGSTLRGTAASLALGLGGVFAASVILALCFFTSAVLADWLLGVLALAVVVAPWCNGDTLTSGGVTSLAGLALTVSFTTSRGLGLTDTSASVTRFVSLTLGVGFATSGLGLTDTSASVTRFIGLTLGVGGTLGGGWLLLALTSLADKSVFAVVVVVALAGLGLAKASACFAVLISLTFGVSFATGCKGNTRARLTLGLVGIGTVSVGGAAS